MTRRTSKRRRFHRLRANVAEVAGCVFVGFRAARTTASAALRRSGLHYSYFSRAESGGTPRYTFSGSGAQYAAFLAALPTNTTGLDIYCD